MNKYQKLRKLYNDTFYPDGVPLEFGCEVETTLNGRVYTCACEWYEESFITKGQNLVKFSSIKQNLGKPLTLQDVLRLLDLSSITYNYHNEMIWVFEYEADDQPIRIDIDLSIPFHEQPEEVFEKIYKLVKE